MPLFVIKMMLHALDIKGLYFRFKPEFWKEIKKARINAGDYWNEVACKLGVGVDHMKDIRSTEKYPYGQKAVSLELLFRILAYSRENGVRINIENQKLISAVRYGHRGKWVRGPQFPLDLLDKRWAGILGACITDGHLQPDGKVYFINANRGLAESVIELVKGAIGDMDIKLSTKRRENKVWYVVVFPKLLGQVLIRNFGMKPGNKVKNNIPLPAFLKNLDATQSCYKLFLSEFLKWTFSCDGWVNASSHTIGICFNRDVTNLSTSFIRNSNYASQLLLDIKGVLAVMGIRTSKPYFMGVKVRKNGRLSAKWRIEIHNREGLTLFAGLIGFVIDEKSAKLESILKNVPSSTFKVLENHQMMSNLGVVKCR